MRYLILFDDLEMEELNYLNIKSYSEDIFCNNKKPCSIRSRANKQTAKTFLYLKPVLTHVWGYNHLRLIGDARNRLPLSRQLILSFCLC